MTMRDAVRPALAVAVAVVMATGCTWFRQGDGLYAKDAGSRPLEVPPEFDSAAATAAPAMASAVRPGAASAPGGTAIGFTVPGTRDAVFARVGTALEGIQGVTIASRAQLVGAFDVAYGGSNFLVRVSDAEAGAYVSAVDPRGVAASGDAPARLIEALKAALAR